jgi:uncharacterized membrane-anchored protein
MNYIHRLRDTISDINPWYYVFVALGLLILGLFFTGTGYIASLIPGTLPIQLFVAIAVIISAVLLSKALSWMWERGTGLAKFLILLAVIAFAVFVSWQPYFASQASNLIARIDPEKFKVAMENLGYKDKEIPKVPDKSLGEEGINKIKAYIGKKIPVDYPKIGDYTRTDYIETVLNAILANNPQEVGRLKALYDKKYTQFYLEKSKTLYDSDWLAVGIFILCQAALALINLVKAWKFLGGLVKLSLGGLIMGAVLVLYMKYFYIPDGPAQSVTNDLWWKGFLIHIPQLMINLIALVFGASNEAVKRFATSKNVFVRVLFLCAFAVGSQILGSLSIDSLFQYFWLLDAVKDSGGRLTSVEVYLIYQSGAFIAGLSITSLYSAGMKILSGEATSASVK